MGGAAGTAKYTTPFISKVQIERGKPWLHGRALHVPSVSFLFVWSGGMDMVCTIYAGHLILCGCNLQWIFQEVQKCVLVATSVQWQVLTLGQDTSLVAGGAASLSV